MAEEFERLHAGKHSIAQELFIKTADENYVTARFCFANELNVDFFWNAVHGLEKYLKAALLMNGRSGKDFPDGGKRRLFRHNIVELLDAVRPLAPELIPSTLVRPDVLPEPYWREEPIEQFVSRLYDMGNEHNRYQLTGYVCRSEDLLKFDLLVFAIRRLCQPLEVHFLGKPRHGVPDESKRQRMERDHPSSSDLQSTFEQIAGGGRGPLLREVALNWNIPFAPADYPHPPLRYGASSANPVLVRRILEPLDSGDAQQAIDSDQLWQWAQDNIFIPKEYVKAYNDDRLRRKATVRKK
ncbi:hypothetical protein [Bradyrhizobium sp. CCBAU 45384]|uniref:hypothetical protein n=1 Tax=Bradyrhizobium sp. CCBAU 45384 TaxID=858428 RepID=UPI00230583DF|nr:hypothetical protein [Bradyrhizobium sp. CCBAU 45384]MDA9408901.1 hypothetical protein [Bradyrhizobium sp. CCBAU 45384]